MTTVPQPVEDTAGQHRTMDAGLWRPFLEQWLQAVKTESLYFRDDYTLNSPHGDCSSHLQTEGSPSPRSERNRREFSFPRRKHFCTRLVHRSWKQVPLKVSSEHNQVDIQSFKETYQRPTPFQVCTRCQGNHRRKDSRALPSGSLHSRRGKDKHKTN